MAELALLSRMEVSRWLLLWVAILIVVFLIPAKGNDK
jgi:hypothetical protein